MATLKNNGSHLHIIERIDGAQCPVGPGETIQTYSAAAATLTGMVVIDQAPHFNPAIERTDLTSTGAGDDKTILLDAGADRVEVINSSASATITVYLGSTANVPGPKVVPQSSRTVDAIKGKVSALVLQFDAAVSAGECYVTQLR